MGFCDEVIAEPTGGAQNDYDAAAALLAESLERHLSQLEKLPLQQLLDARYKKFRDMAQYYQTV
jgi:acetyl-CoA carboxylase carboxyl transferase subunit alpha